MMVAREIEYGQVNRNTVPGPAVLEIEGLQVRGDLGYLAVKDATLDIRSGEIVSIAGVAGNGQRNWLRPWRDYVLR